MPSPNKAISGAVARIATTVAYGGQDDPRLPGLRRDLRAAKLTDYAERLVAGWPPLTEEQKAKIIAVLQAS